MLLVILPRLDFCLRCLAPILISTMWRLTNARPFHVKYGSVRKRTMVKVYTCVFVSLSLKAVHLELSSDLTTEAFIACPWRLISQRGKLSVIWSDHEVTSWVPIEKLQTSSNTKNSNSHFGFFLNEKHRMGIYTRKCPSF